MEKEQLLLVIFHLPIVPLNSMSLFKRLQNLRFTFIEKKYLFLLLIIIVVIVFVGVLWMIFFKRSSISVEQHQLLQAQQDIESAVILCDKTENPESCKGQTIKRVATKIGTASLCQSLEGDFFYNCIWQVAIESKNPDACLYLSDVTDIQNCQNAVYWKQAMDSSYDLYICEKILDTTIYNRCVEVVSKAIARTSGCEGTGIDPLWCEKQNAYNIVIASQDITNCLSLDPAYYELCEETILTQLSTKNFDQDEDGLTLFKETAIGTSDREEDTDQDGLSDQEEVEIYFTNPLEKDTDEDGYEDGQEVQAGYNPNGDGTL